ncbi:AAA family ATPase [bacterium]|nr:AAA family ATPase [bacterium]
MNEDPSYSDLYAEASRTEAVRQVAEVCEKATQLTVSLSSDGLSFSSMESTKKDGILHAAGNVSEHGVLALRLEFLRVSGSPRIAFTDFFKHLSVLGEKTRLMAPFVTRSGESSLCVELRIQASPLSYARSTALMTELKNLEALAKTLQAQLPRSLRQPELAKLYDQFFDIVEPVYALDLDTTTLNREWIDWAKLTMDFLSGSACVALPACYPISEDFALALLATAAIETGVSIGRYVAPLSSPKSLVDTAKKAPGTVAMPAMRLSLGTNAYELANEVQAMLVTLHSSRKPVIFTGSDEQLRSIFHGGQGGLTNPLSPVVRHAPEASMEVLTHFAVRTMQRRVGGMPASMEEYVVQEILAGLKPYSPTEQKRILPVVANHALNTWANGKSLNGQTTATFAVNVSSVSETLAGMSAKPRVTRAPAVQQRFTLTFTDADVTHYLKRHLLGQDSAIDQLVSRLRMEALTRPLHQPLRYCAQGTPATGKSESAVLLASKLGIPYMNVDAASIPDYYSAAAQLLGSGRGIVGSYQSGRLEQAAKQHTGVLIEVSDLDHANERVRSGLADLFLQVLETGEAQSAAGAMFSCANLIFAFTMNLPDGMDESVRKGFGFNDSVDNRQLQNRVVTEIKRMLSTAFLSRVGTPILFEPLNGDAIATILERAVRAAITAAAERMGFVIGEIVLQEGLGKRIAASAQARLGAFGARALLEQGRVLAADAVVSLQNTIPAPERKLSVSLTESNKLLIE